MKRLHVAVECFEADCYEPAAVMVKLHRRSEPLLTAPDFGSCRAHLPEAVTMAVEYMLQGDECMGVSVMLP